MAKIIKTYSELIKLPTRKDRLEYLMLYGKVGDKTFGKDRYLNQIFYNSKEWKEFRNDIIVRDKGCDLALDGYDIISVRDLEHAFNSRVITKCFIHHIDPITPEDILRRSFKLFDPENVVLVTKKTHDIVHYAFTIDEAENGFVKRRPNDTKLW